MLINRRKLLIGSAVTALAAGLPHIASTMPAKVIPQRDDLAILMQNLDRWADHRRQYNNPIPLADVRYLTTKMWERCYVRHLIPIEAATVHQHPEYKFLQMIRMRDTEMTTKTKRLGVRLDLDLAYDGCMACANSSRWPHETERCRAAEKIIINQWLDGLAVDAADEFNNEFLATISYNATQHDPILRNDSRGFITDVRRLVAQMAVPARWIVMSPELIAHHQHRLAMIDSVRPDGPAAHLDDMAIYRERWFQNQILIGHNESHETAIMSGIHLLLLTNGVVIDPQTFMPCLPFAQQKAVWMVRDRMPKHFIRARTRA